MPGLFMILGLSSVAPFLPLIPFAVLDFHTSVYKNPNGYAACPTQDTTMNKDCGGYMLI